MLNKKAIAALAAGATLVSGLAFAAPAMAACPVPAPLKSVASTNVNDAKTAYDNAKTALDGMTVSEDATGNVPTITPAAGKTVSAYYKVNADTTIELFNNAIDADIKAGEAAALRTFAAKRNAHVASQNAYNAQKSKVAELLQKWVDAQYVLDHCATPDPDKKQEAIDNVRDAAKNLQNADNDFAKAKKAYYAAKDAFLKAQAELNARTAAYNAATTALENFRASGVNDSAKEQRLADAVNRANAHLARATEAYGKAEADYNKTYADALAAKQAYNDALQAYKNAYDAAVAAGVNPALLPPVKTADPLDESFNPVPGAKELYAEALSGKFGKAAQAAAKKATAKKGEAKKEAGKKGASAAAPAGAKLDTKAAAAASAAPLSKTGVTVMFTALAASMLAGIGAAVRKFRH